MKVLSDKKTLDINKLNKNLLQEYLQSYSYILHNNNNTEDQQNEKLLIYVLTYNIHGSMPNENEIKLLFPKKENFEKFDIFVINTQECLRSIGASFFVNSKEPWINALSNFFGENYINIINSNLGAIHLAIFIKKEKAIYFSDLRNGDIKTGFLNIMANKGAVSASMKYYDKHILFICCHLTAGHESKNDRNNDLNRIGNSLLNSSNFASKNKLKQIKKSIFSDQKKFNSIKQKRFRNKSVHLYNTFNDRNKNERRHSLGFLSSKNIIYNEDNNINQNEENNNEEVNIKRVEENERLNSTNKNNQKKSENNNELEEIFNQNKSFSSIDNENYKKDKLIDDYDFVILSGDLNYRINIDSKQLNELMDKKDPEILWDKDQLTEDIKSKHNFKEGTINFMPTYKYKENSNEYDYSRIPGWTDRILYKSKKYYDIMLCEYSSINNINLSDHKPVYAIFKIDCKDKKFINNKYKKIDEECCIM